MKIEQMGLLKFYTTTTHVAKVIDGAVYWCPVTPLSKAASLAGHIGLLAAAGAVGRLASEMSHR